MRTTIKIIMLALMVGATPVYSQGSATAQSVAATVKAAVSEDKESVLAIVSAAVAANPEFAGEIVAAAIQATNASNELVGQIVEVAVTVAPTRANVIVQSAFVAAPSARANIIAAAARASRGNFNEAVALPPASSGGSEDSGESVTFGEADPLEIPGSKGVNNPIFDVGTAFPGSPNVFPGVVTNPNP